MYIYIYLVVAPAGLLVQGVDGEVPVVFEFTGRLALYICIFIKNGRKHICTLFMCGSNERRGVFMYAPPDALEERGVAFRLLQNGRLLCVSCGRVCE